MSRGRVEDEPWAGRGGSPEGAATVNCIGGFSPAGTSPRALNCLPFCPQLGLLVCTVSLKSDRQTVTQGSRSLEIVQLLQREEASEAQAKPGSVTDAKNISPSVTVNQTPQALQSCTGHCCLWRLATPTLALQASAWLCALGHVFSKCSFTEALGRVTRRSRQKHRTPVKFEFKKNDFFNLKFVSSVFGTHSKKLFVVYPNQV